MVKDKCLSKDWQSNNLIQTRSSWYLNMTGFTFMCGIREFDSRLGNIAIVFDKDRVYTFVKDGQPATTEEIKRDIRDSIRMKDIYFPEGCVDYIEFCECEDWQGSVIEWFNISKEELQGYYEDISQMWELEEIPLSRSEKITQQNG